MKILSNWLRSYLPTVAADDKQLAEDLTLRGIAVEGIFDLGAHGSLFDMDITTNRVDAMNHYGIAREIAAIYNLPLKLMQIESPAASPAKTPYPVVIEEPRPLRTLHRPRPPQHQDRAIARHSSPNASACSIKSSSRTRSTPQTSSHSRSASPPTPLTSTRSKAESSSAAPAKAKSSAPSTAVERNLDPEDLIVADHVKPLGIAGVMGGWDSMITPETKNILVEAAWFDPGTVRRSSRRHGLHTDASHRFERGADFNAAPIANALVSQLVLEAGGEIEGDLVDVIIPEVQARTANRPAISLHVSEVQRILGKTEAPEGITAETIESVLTALGCKLEKSAEGAYAVTLPSWRLDLEREIDLIEEVARVYGYNRFANTLPAFAGSVVALPTPKKNRPCAAHCSRSAGTKPSPALSVLQPTRSHLRRNPTPPSKSATRSAKKPGCSAPRSFLECSPCSPAI